MRVGTKSLLFGVHQVFIHPFVVAYAWYKLFGFPTDCRIWFSFIVHDWGYWGSPNMNGKEGDNHVHLGAKIMKKLFGIDWYYFCLFHSRFYAKSMNAKPSKLCIADKYAIAVEPWWMYLPRAWLSGELKEYLSTAKTDKRYNHMDLKTSTAKKWYLSMQRYMRIWVAEHKNGEVDNETGT